MAQEPAGGELSEIEFSVPSMVCVGGADKIRRKLTALPGVEAVELRLWRKAPAFAQAVPQRGGTM